MPCLKKKEDQIRAELFGELYRIGKARLGLTEEQCAAIAGVCPKTLFNAKKTQAKESVSESLNVLALYSGGRTKTI